KIRTGADFFNGSLKEDGAVGDRDFLHLILKTFKESGMVGAGLLQRLELFGGNTGCTQVADGGSRRAGETRKLSNRREIGQLVPHRRLISGPDGQCFGTDCGTGSDTRRGQLPYGQAGCELREAE